MQTLKIVIVDINGNGIPCFPDIPVAGKIRFFIFETAEPALNLDVIGPAAFSVHADPDIVALYKVNVFLAGELTSLVGIQDDRFRNGKCLL